MTLLIAESFDGATAIGDLAGTGSWDAINTYGFTATTRWGYGRALDTNVAGGGATKDSGVNSATYFVTWSHMQTSGGLSAQYPYFQIRDGGTSQVSLTFEGDGAIRVRAGANGALLATWTGAYVANSFDGYTAKIVIDPVAGSVEIRKNGSAGNNFSVFNINTRQGTSNSRANGFAIANLGSGVRPRVVFDDLMVFAGDGIAPTDWPGDVRAWSCSPLTDSSTQFSRTSTGSLAFGTTTNNSTRALTNGVIQTGEIISATQGGTMTSCTVEFNANFTGRAKAALYLADGNQAGFLSDSQPGTLIAVSNEVTNPTTGLNTFTFPSTVGVMKGYSYFFAVITDGAATLKANSATATCYTYTTTYAGGFPQSLIGSTAGTVTRITVYAPSGLLTASNAGCVSDEAEDGLTTFLQSNVVGQQDQYTVQPLPYAPVSILGVLLKSFLNKSSNSGRGFEISAQSGATPFLTTEYTPGVAFATFQQFYNTDPNTGMTWTRSGVEALTIGPRVSS